MPTRQISPEGIEKIRAANERRFIEDATAKFGNKFDYSQIKYQKQIAPITIICPEHGSFQQTPVRHLNSVHGCPQCGVDARASQKVALAAARFLKIFRDRHGDRLVLLSDYENAKERIKVRCSLHDLEFEITPDRLMTAKHACPKCVQDDTRNRLRLSQEEFVSRLREKYGDRISLEKTRYVDTETPLVITCERHGDVEVDPRYFYRSTHGCPKCGNEETGYAGYRLQKLESGEGRSKGATKIGVMKVEVFGIQSYKLGITSRTIEKRYREFVREVLFEATLDEYDALKLERLLHGKYAEYRDTRIFKAGMRNGKRWAGDSEVYFKKAIPKIIEDLEMYVNELSQKDPEYWSRQPNLEPPILQVRKVPKSTRHSSKPRQVICLNTTVVYDSVHQAARETGTSQGNVSAVCAGKRTQAKGLRFAYLEDYQKGIILCERPLMNIGNHQKSARRVLCVETSEIFETIAEAARAKGCSGSHITSVCKGRRRIAGGYRWNYVDDSTEEE